MSAPMDPEDARREGPSAPPTILIVDDDIGIRSNVLELLQLSGYEVFSASDGVEALGVMQRHTPNLIISDINMPGMDGYTFFKSVRTNTRWALVPFIFLTARDQPLDVRHGISLGVDQYLVKPFDPDDLLVAVEARLSRIREIEDAAHNDVEAMKHRLMTTISHELRTPLTHIYGFVNLLHEEQDNLTREETERMVVAIQQGADRLVKLVEDLLLVARLDSGEIDAEVRLNRYPAQLALLAAEAVVQHARESDRLGVEVIVQVPDGFVVSCEPNRLRDVLSRLISNSIKFSRGPGSHVWLTAERGADGSARITVQDDGIGISADHQKLLFQQFGQIDREQHEQQGLGMGLMIARGIIRAHHGDIEVSSEGVSGQGAAFTVVLPAESRAS